MLERLAFTRFVAAMAVVCFHLGPGVPYIDDRPWSPVVMAGPVAVTFFFVLSGFIMASVYGDLQWNGARDYWRARFARIYPVYLLGLALSIGRDSSLVGWLLSLLLVQAWVPGYALSANLVGWSLSVEIFFYLLFPALIVVARRTSLIKWCGGVALFWLATQAWAVFAAHEIAGPYRSPSHQFVHYFPVPYLSSFLIGITAALLVSRRQVAWRPAAAAGAAVLSLAAAAAALMLGWPSGVPAHLGLLSPLFAVGIVGLYYLPSRWRESAPAQLVGESSYALYILHWPLAPVLKQVIAPGLGLSPVGGFCLSVAVLLALSVAVYLRIEKPARAALKRRTAVATAA